MADSGEMSCSINFKLQVYYFPRTSTMPRPTMQSNSYLPARLFHAYGIPGDRVPVPGSIHV